MRATPLPLLLALLLPGGACAPPPPRAPALGSLLGTYDLVGILGGALPVREFQAVYHAGEITLQPNQVYVSQIDAETCDAANVCTREIARAVGVWVLLPDGTIEFDPHDHSHVPEVDRDPLAGDVPPPRVVADGREIRYYTRSERRPIFTYRRR